MSHIETQTESAVYHIDYYRKRIASLKSKYEALGEQIAASEQMLDRWERVLEAEKEAILAKNDDFGAKNAKND